MNNILMNAEVTKAFLEYRKIVTRRASTNIKAIAIKYIGQNATGDTPSFEMAERGQELLVVKILDSSHWGWQNGYRYSCQDIKKRYDSFYVEEDEVRLIFNYQIGETIWVREPAKVTSVHGIHLDFKYLADEDKTFQSTMKIPSRFRTHQAGGSIVNYPKWISNHQGIPNGCIKEMARIFLKITNVRVELLQDITFEDIFKEGFNGKINDYFISVRYKDKAMTANTRKEKEVLDWWINLWNKTAPKDHQWESSPHCSMYALERINEDGSDYDKN